MARNRLRASGRFLAARWNWGNASKQASGERIREEVGLEVEVGPIVEVFERITPDERGVVRYHYVLIDYLCRPTGGSLLAADDADDARWVTLSELQSLVITAGTVPVIEKAFRMLNCASS